MLILRKVGDTLIDKKTSIYNLLTNNQQAKKESN